MNIDLLLAIVIGVAVLLFLILYFRIHAFLALIIASIVSGLLAGMSPDAILQSIQTGMGGTLGFVAVVVGLGALFGAILEYSGGAYTIANTLIKKFGDKNASLSMVITGFIVAIPVFFDVAFILLIYVVYALQEKSGRSLLYYALPLLAGLAITHAFVPPTPGPVAVAEILKADLGYVILIGIFTGIPAAVIGGIFFTRYISKKIVVSIPEYIEQQPRKEEGSLPSISAVILIITLPVFLIILASVLSNKENLLILGFNLKPVISFLGHPFTALIIANLIAWYFLGIKRGGTKQELYKVSEKSLLPAGIIILITGAGGVFKQVLIDTGAGEQIAASMAGSNFSFFIFAFVSAGIVRILQGSATVAMITAAALTAPLLPDTVSEVEKALTVIAISSGASLLSHVNDSGFWLVNRYLGLTVPQTFSSWTALTTIIGLTGFIAVLIISIFV
ncbi:MAG: GntP family permease [Candidatus Cyclobacteriaceae bacterium M2_1C_046]